MLERESALPHAIRRAAERSPDALAAADVTGRTVTFAGLAEVVERWAAAFAGLGVSAGDRVLTMVPNSFEAYYGWLGAAWLRAIEVPLNTVLEGAQIDSENWVGVFNTDYRVMRDAFRAPEALEHTVLHRSGDLPATRLFEMRISELPVHGWDLARAIGADETLDAEVVAVVWALYERSSKVVGTSGAFGAGASGKVPESAPLQTTLLDLLGRRP